MSSLEYDQLIKIMHGRRSVRRYKDWPVERATIEQILHAASWAPSATNRQDWFFSVVESSGTKAEIAEMVRNKWNEIIAGNREYGSIEEIERYASTFGDVDNAPVVIVVSAAAPNTMQKQLLGDLAQPVSGSATSAAMAVQNLMLAAHSLGLASCPMTGAIAAGKEIAQLLDLGRRREIVCIVTLGYPDLIPEVPSRKEIASIVRFY